MALERKTRLEAIQIADDGTLLIRMKKTIVDGGEVLKEEWHRTAIPPGIDPDAQMQAVADHLATMGFEAPPAADKALVKTIAQDRHTPGVKAAYAAKREREQAEPEGVQR